MTGGATNEPSELRRAVGDAFSPITIGLVAVLAVATVVGSIASLSDGEGEAIVPMVPIAAPTVVGVWAVLETLWRKTTLPFHIRVITSTIAATAPNAIISAIAWAAAGALGSGTIADASAGLYDHYWWPKDALGAGAGILMLFASWGIGGGIAILTLIVLVLPLKAVGTPLELFGGTGLSTTPEHLPRNITAVRLLFGGLSVSILAIIAWVLSAPVALSILLTVISAALIIPGIVMRVRVGPRRRLP